LAEKPKQIVMRDEIYHRLWPGPMNYDGSNKPYERQISDHKRRCVAQIKKGIVGKINLMPGDLENLILTRPKVGYMLTPGAGGGADSQGPVGERICCLRAYVELIGYT